MSKLKYKFYNLPKRRTLEDYEELARYLVDRYCRIKGLVSIYEWGDVSDPGISDMDLIFVFKGKKADSMPLFKRGFYMLSRDRRYTARHPFFYIDGLSFRDIKYVYPEAALKLLYGKDIRIKNISSKGLYFPKIALLNDIITRHYPRDFLEQSLKRSINVRDTLLRLNSLKYSIRTLEMLTKEKNRWNGKLKKIAFLRKNWFRRNNFESLISCVNDATDITMGLISGFRNFLIKNNFVKIKSGSCAEYNDRKNGALFVKNWSPENALKRMKDYPESRKDFCSVLPIELAPQQIEYSRHEGRVSSHIKAHLKTDIKYELGYKKTAEKRIAVFNAQTELAAGLRHSDFAAFFDFGYRNRHGINNAVFGMIRNLRN